MDSITFERHVLNDFAVWLSANHYHITKGKTSLRWPAESLVNRYLSVEDSKPDEPYEPKTEAEIDAYLREAGYDPEQVGRMGVKVALAAADQSPLNPKNVKIAQLEAEIANLTAPDKMVVTKAAWERKQNQAELQTLIWEMPPDSYLMHCPVMNQVAWQAIVGDIDSPDCKIAWGDTPLETLQKLIPMLKEKT